METAAGRLAAAGRSGQQNRGGGAYTEGWEKQQMDRGNRRKGGETKRGYQQSGKAGAKVKVWSVAKTRVRRFHFKFCFASKRNRVRFSSGLLNLANETIYFLVILRVISLPIFRFQFFASNFLLCFFSLHFASIICLISLPIFPF